MAMGGYTGSTYLKSVEIYNPAVDSWTGGPPMMIARSEHATVYLDHYVYAIGGCNAEGHLAAVERFDVLNKHWELVTSMRSPRMGLGMHV